MQLIANPRIFNPIYWHLKPLLRDPKIRYIYLEGGSSASKTSGICDAVSLDQIEHLYNVICFRRLHVDLKDSIYSSFELSAKRTGIYDVSIFQEDLIKKKINKTRIRFKGLDNEENIKGLENYDLVINNEWSQFTEDQWSQQRKRLRGRPNQKFINDWNPISAKLWQYEKWLDLDTWIDLPLDMPGSPTTWTSLNKDYSFKRINKIGDSVWFKITYRDNYWVVGHPSGQGGFIDKNVLKDFEFDRVYKPNYYRIYANGERGIMRTGGEFWKQFNEIHHVKPISLKGLPLHVSLDENVNPYVTIGLWQYLPKEQNIRQVHEIPCKTPDNNAPKAAAKLVKWLQSNEFEDVIYIYGDPSGNRRSTIDRNSSSFYDKFIEVLRSEGYTVQIRVEKSAPEVALSASFINDIYENNLYGFSITISDKCKVSIDDYLSVKEDIDGSMKKTKEKDRETQVTYEPIGHFSDAKRYFIISLLAAEFKRYKTRTLTRRRGSISIPS